jgi:hypothetical protein
MHIRANNELKSCTLSRPLERSAQGLPELNESQTMVLLSIIERLTFIKDFINKYVYV